MDYLLRLRVAHHRWDPTAYFCSFKLQHRGLVLLLVLCHVSNKHFRPGVNLDRYTQFKWFNNGKHKECPQILHHISVPPKTISYISAIITNCQGYRCCDRNSMGRSCLQLDALHVGKPWEFQIRGNIKPLDPKTVASVVQYGRLSLLLVHEAKGDSLIYNQLYPFEGLKNYTSGIIHHVRLTGLKPDTKYYYRCGDPSVLAMSKVFSFKTMPVSGPRSYPSRIAVLGDLGLTYNSTSTVDHMKRNRPDLILLVGDVTYANLYLTNGTGSDCYSCSFPDTPIHETYQPRWDYWGRFMQPLLSKVPLMVVEGNHEIEEQAGNLTFAAYSSRFAFPSHESGSASTFYYSFNAGGIHFLMLGAYTAYHKSADQYKWLKRDLAKVNRKETPWLVAVWHAPWYSSYRAHYREAECMRVAMEEILYNAGVDIVFNGHVHAYERSNRVYNYTLVSCGPVYITVGDGGNREKMAITHADEPGNCPEPSTTPDEFMGGFCAYNFTSGPAAGKFCWEQQPEFSAYRESSFGHGILEVKNKTHALWTWHRNQDLYDQAGDQIYIVRQPDRCPVEEKVTKLWGSIK